MSSNGLVSLGLRIERAEQKTGASDPEADVFRGILGEAFEILSDAIEVGDSTPKVAATVANCRAAIASGLSAVRAGRQFPVEPVRTLDGVHHATIEAPEGGAAVRDVCRYPD